MDGGRAGRLRYWAGAGLVFTGLAYFSPAWAGTGIDLGWLGKIDFTRDFCMGIASIVLIDLVLGGDNAVVIALAVKNLQGRQRRTGIILGVAAAVTLRVVLTFFVSQILQIRFLKFVGGIFILWIAVKLFIEGAPEDRFRKEATTFWQAVRVIMIADLIMSTDNILAVGGACKGNLFLLLFGLALSIPLVVFTSSLLSMLMNKYPVIVWIGAAVLGRVGGEMISTDPWIVQKIAPGREIQIACEVIGAMGVLAAARLYLRRMNARKAAAPARGTQPVD